MQKETEMWNYEFLTELLEIFWLKSIDRPEKDHWKLEKMLKQYLYHYLHNFGRFSSQIEDLGFFKNSSSFVKQFLSTIFLLHSIM